MALSISACSGDDVKEATGGETTPVGGDTGGTTVDAPTWHGHIAPIVVKRCSACHTRGGVGPFPLDSYAAAAPLAGSMVEAVDSGRMPPFLADETDACTPRHAYADDTRLTSEQKALLREWASSGAPEGDARRAAAIERPRALGLAREDAVMQLPSPIAVEHGSHGDLHTCLIVDPKLARDVYVVGRHITPGNDKVLHHVVTYVLKPQRADATGARVSRDQMLEALRATKGVGIGERYDCFGGPGLDATGLASEQLGAWAPGAAPTLSPPDSGQPVAKDALVVMDLHYHPIAQREEDRDTKLSLMFADARPALVSFPIFLGNFTDRFELPSGFGELVKQPGESAAEFKIPAGAKNHVEEMSWTWMLPNAPPGQGVRAYFAGTHMHYVGRDMMVQLENTSPAPGESPRECLVHTPRWDFNWQRGYGWQATYDKLPLMNRGDVVRMRCVYDNTMDNPFLARALAEQGLTAPVDVRLGEDTLDEMCLATIGLIYPNPQP